MEPKWTIRFHAYIWEQPEGSCHSKPLPLFTCRRIHFTSRNA